jgi:hypothetical protein
MNPDQLREYKREKSRQYNAKNRELRLQDKARQGNLQGTAQDDNQDDNQGNLQGSNQGNNQDELSLQDVMDILDTKMDIIQNKLETIIESNFETIIESKLDLLETKLETIMENKLYEPLDKLENNQPQPSIFFA